MCRLLKGKTGSEIKGVGLMKVFSHWFKPERDITGARAGKVFFHRLGPGSDVKRARLSVACETCADLVDYELEMVLKWAKSLYRVVKPFIMAPKRSATASGAVPKRKRKMLMIAEKSIGPGSMAFLRSLLDKLATNQQNILKFIACNEIFLMPATVFMLFRCIFVIISVVKAACYSLLFTTDSSPFAIHQGEILTVGWQIHGSHRNSFYWFQSCRLPFQVTTQSNFSSTTGSWKDESSTSGPDKSGTSVSAGKAAATSQTKADGTGAASPVGLSPAETIQVKAMEVWGSQEALVRERKLRKEVEKEYKENLFRNQKLLKEYKDFLGNTKPRSGKRTAFLQGPGKVVMVAICIYGFSNMRYIASLISGVGIFMMGAGLSWYHGIMGLIQPHPIESLLWAYCILAGSLVSEGATLLVAVNEIRKSARLRGISFYEYVMQSRDPSTNVVLLEDAAAVLGVILAGGCMGLTSLTGNPYYDSIGSLGVGTLLGVVSAFLIYTNTEALLGRSIQPEQAQKLTELLENDPAVRAIHDVKATDIGLSKIRFKAEVDFDGRVVTRSYLEKQDIEQILQEIQQVKTPEDLENFMLKHGENIIDTLGAEVDRLEKELKNQLSAADIRVAMRHMCMGAVLIPTTFAITSPTSSYLKSFLKQIEYLSASFSGKLKKTY
ncbi:ZNT9 protein, partial [Polypterus senegalus]